MEEQTDKLEVNTNMRKQNQKRAKLKKWIKTVFCGVFMGCVGIALIYCFSGSDSESIPLNTEETEIEAETDVVFEEEPVNTESPEEEEEKRRRQELITQADRLAASYDYEGAIGLIQTWEGYEADAELQEKISACESARADCVPVNMDDVTHVFYHSLVVDPARAFANQEKDFQAVGNNQWMTTISEFQKITQEMYDRGYVIVSIHDLVDVSTDENGNFVFSPAEIMLPPGKRAYVLSQDDLSYYHCYDNYGFASKIVLDEEGKPVCEYIQEDGTRVTGAYDVVPLLDDFIEEHPDASYRGAKGIIALTGYNGILGYRTDSSYVSGSSDLNEDKKIWLKEHPDFDLERERAEAKKVAEAMKEDGWEFASHTWGHIKISDSSLGRLQWDTQRWRENVEPLVGPVDTIIFAHGQDLGDWGEYPLSDGKYKYLREQGYRIFCNVDSNLYRTWFGRDYLRQGRRNLDGYRIYRNAAGMEDNISDLFDAAEIIDPLRPPVPPLK